MTHDAKTLQKFRDGQSLYQQERWAEALRVFDDLSLSYKSDSEIMLNRAMCLARLGKEEEAELLCDHITIVHKDPRGAQLKAEIPLWKREGKAAPIEKKQRKPLLSPEFLKLGMIACFVVALLMAAWTFYSNYEAPIPQAIGMAPAPGERVLRFPEGVSLGTLTMRAWGYDTDLQGGKGAWNPLGEARGKVTVPAGMEVQLSVSVAQAGNLAALRRLRANDLQYLHMNSCPISNADMAYLSHLTGLFYLSIDDTPIGPEGFAHLLRLTSLRTASIVGTAPGEPGRALLAQQPYLATIDADRTGLADEWLAGLPPMGDLIFLSLDDTKGISDAGVAQIAKHVNLEQVFLSYTELTDAGMKAIHSLKHLRRAWFEGTRITDASMEGFRFMPNIQEIGIAYTPVTNEGLMRLSDIRTLKKVGIKGCDQITLDGIRRFKAVRPDVFVETELNV